MFHLCREHYLLLDLHVADFVRQTAGPPYSIRAAAIDFDAAHVRIGGRQRELYGRSSSWIESRNPVRIQLTEPHQVSRRVDIDGVRPAILGWRRKFGDGARAKIKPDQLAC